VTSDEDGDERGVKLHVSDVRRPVDVRRPAAFNDSDVRRLTTTAAAAGGQFRWNWRYWQCRRPDEPVSVLLEPVTAAAFSRLSATPDTVLCQFAGIRPLPGCFVLVSSHVMYRGHTAGKGP